MAYQAVTWNSRDIVEEVKLDKMTANQELFYQALITGWWEDTDTWVYVSTTSFKIVGKDVTAKFTKGTKIRYKQGGAYEYGIVASSAFSADTTVTLIINTDYALADAVITDAGYSYVENPQGFPHWFAYSPTWSGGITIGNAIVEARFTVANNICKVMMEVVIGSTTIMGATTFSLPITYKNTALPSLANIIGTAFFEDNNGVDVQGIVSAEATGGTGTARVYCSLASGNYTSITSPSPTIPFTWVQDVDSFIISASYEIA